MHRLMVIFIWLYSIRVILGCSVPFAWLWWFWYLWCTTSTSWLFILCTWLLCVLCVVSPCLGISRSVWLLSFGVGCAMPLISIFKMSHYFYIWFHLTPHCIVGIGGPMHVWLVCTTHYVCVCFDWCAPIQHCDYENTQYLCLYLDMSVYGIGHGVAYMWLSSFPLPSGLSVDL